MEMGECGGSRLLRGQQPKALMLQCCGAVAMRLIRGGWWGLGDFGANGAALAMGGVG